jgi:hypothetical protein
MHLLYDEDDNKPVWPTWAVGALFRGMRHIHINHSCFNLLYRIFCGLLYAYCIEYRMLQVSGCARVAVRLPQDQSPQLQSTGGDTSPDPESDRLQVPNIRD